MTLPTHPEARLSGLGRTVARTLWLALVAPLVAAFVVGVPVRFNLLRQVTPETTPSPLAQLGNLPNPLLRSVSGALGPAEAEALVRLGLTPEGYATLILTAEILQAVVGLSIGSLLFWRRSDDWLTLWFSWLLILLGVTGSSLVVPSLMTVSAFWNAVYVLGAAVGMSSSVSLLFLSPDGHFAPRWGLPAAAGVSGCMLGIGAYGGVTSRGDIPFSLIFLFYSMWMIGLGLGIYAQFFRYWNISTTQQRQQMKWLNFGWAAIILGVLAGGPLLLLAGQQPGLLRVLYGLSRTAILTTCMLLFPICVAFAMLRYRLWDIDVLIRRTLQYSLLSGLLASISLISIVVLQSAFAVFGGPRSEIVTVASTLVIAALFFPLRNRVQAFVDRRFYRRKYDAAKTLAAFAVTARDETDLNVLTARLAQVVDETLQPENVSVWLKPARPVGINVSLHHD